MATRYELINLANAAHNHANQAPVPNDWEVELDNKGNEIRHFGDISLAVYQNSDGAKVIAIRGSDSFDGGDWANNIQGFGLGELTSDIKALLTFVDNYRGDNPNISVTGFSQGGGLAELISHTFGLEGLSIDGPGAGAITNDPAYQTYLDDLKITAQGTPEGFVALKEQGSPVGSLGESLSTEETVNYVQGSYDNGNIPDYTDDADGTLSHQHNLKNITDGSLPSFSLLAQRKRTKRNGTPMSVDGFSKAFLLGEGQLTKITLAQTVPHLYRSNTHKISSPPIRGKEDILKVA